MLEHDLSPSGRHRLRLVRCAALITTLALLGGCAAMNTRIPSTPPPTLDTLIGSAAEEMLADHPELPRHSPLIAATFVNIDNLAHSSTFGRISSELFASELSRSGLEVREVKMRDSLFIEEKIGELILSREVQRLSQAHDARAILMGTYAQGQDTLYLSVRVVRTSDALVLGSASLSVPLDNNLRTMLRASW